MITSKDAAAGEETFFTCFQNKRKSVGAYKGILLRAAMEATMSAPTYFTPLERFVDGGVTTFNNPVLAAIIEALRYGPKGKYDIKHLTVLSFGTACRPQFVTPEGVRNPDGPDAYFWLKWLMTESGDDASDLQNYLLRTNSLFPSLQFRRFQISLDRPAIRKLPDRPLASIDVTDANWLWDLSGKELADIQLDNVDYFDVMKVIGEAMVELICQRASKKGLQPFAEDLIDEKGKELLVTRRGDVARTRKQLSSSAWLDRYHA